MLTVTKTTVSKDANESIGEYSYNLSTTIQDGVLNSVMCRISKSVKTVGSKTPGVPNVNNPVNIGYVQLSGGQISSQIIESEDGTVHLSQFKNFLDEIKKWQENG